MPLLWARVGAPLVLAFCGLCVAIAGLDTIGLAMAAVAAAGWRWARRLPHPVALPPHGPGDAAARQAVPAAAAGLGRPADHDDGGVNRGVGG
jgi:hypothetical protein